MLSELVEDFIHLEGRENSFDQHCGLDGAPSDYEVVFGEVENVVPESCFEVAFHFGEVEIGPRAFTNQLLGIVKVIDGEVEDRRWDRLSVNRHMFFQQVPTLGRTISVAVLGFSRYTFPSGLT